MLNKIVTKSIYSLYNMLKGNQLKKLYREIKSCNDSNKPFEPLKLQRYLKRWGIEDEIENLSVMTKEDIRNHTSNLEQKDVSSYAYTGGSTGDPLKIPYSRQRELIRTASITYYNETGGYRIGDPFLLIRAKKKPRLLQILRNELLFVPFDLSLKNIQKISNDIVDKNIAVVIGYPTVIYDIANYIEENSYLKKNLSIKSIITVSEPIDDHKRTRIKNIFGCNLIDRYSNEETGVIAQQREFSGNYYVDRFGVYTEVIHPETGKPVGENEVGKVVVTDTNNDLIPLIRYDTGDYAMVSEYREGQLFSIRKIVGRTYEEIYKTDGTPISSLSLGPYIHQPFSEENIYCQFQFAQTDKKIYEFRIKGQKSEDFIKPVNRVINGLKSVLGKDAQIEPVFVHSIKALPSGKRPLYRNEMDL